MVVAVVVAKKATTKVNHLLSNNTLSHPLNTVNKLWSSPFNNKRTHA